MRKNMGFVGGGVFRIVLDGCDITVPPTNVPVKRAPVSNPILKMNGNRELEDNWAYWDMSWFQSEVTMLSADIFANATNSTGENAVIIDIARVDGGAGR